jgi:hypothetical protein
LDMTTKVVENNSDSRTSSCLNVSWRQLYLNNKMKYSEV